MTNFNEDDMVCFDKFDEEMYEFDGNNNFILFSVPCALDLGFDFFRKKELNELVKLSFEELPKDYSFAFNEQQEKLFYYNQ